jgi:alanine racemase
VSRFAAEVDLDAVRSNVSELARRAGSAEVLAVVKADGYGHGMIPCARAALEGGASWLGVAFIEEANRLRAAGITAPVLAWLLAPEDDLGAAVSADVQLGVSAEWGLRNAARAAEVTGSAARVHLKADTGLARGGATSSDWPALVATAAKLQVEGAIDVVGVWSHLACAEVPGDPSIARQHAAFEEALAVASAAGIRPQVRHLANSAGTLGTPATHYDLVRPGVSVYGLSPSPELGTSASLGLRPAMRLRADVALVKRVGAGQGVSYGHRYTTDRDTTLVLVPLGYADGVPRHATNVGPVSVNGKRFTVSGTVCMDQFVVDVHDLDVREGDDVVLFGAGDDGEPTADDWAKAVGTINYEIVTRIGGRVPRFYKGGDG